MGLLVAGSWFGSASAQTTAKALDLTDPDDALTTALEDYYYIGLANKSYYLTTSEVKHTSEDAYKGQTFYSLTGVAVADLSAEGNKALFKVTLTRNGANPVFYLTNADGNTIVFCGETSLTATSTALIAADDAASKVESYFSTLDVKSFDDSDGDLFIPNHGGSTANTNVLKLAKTNVTMESTGSGVNLVFYTVDNVAVDVDELNESQGDGFYLNFYKEKTLENKLTIENNPFAKKITAIKAADGEMFFRVSGTWTGFANWASPTTAEISAFRASEFIVVDTVNWSASTNTSVNSFKYVIAKGSEMMNKDGKSYSAYNSNVTETSDKTITRELGNAAFKVEDNANSSYLYISNPEAKATINTAWTWTVTPVTDQQTSLGANNVLSVYNFNGGYYVGTGAGKDTYPVVGADNKLAAGDIVGIVNITSMNTATKDDVYGPTTTGASSVVDAKLVNFKMPEGQWYVTTSSGSFTFTNRESGAEYVAGVLRPTGTANVYKTAAGDSIKVVAAPTTAAFAGWKAFTEKDLTDTNYHISIFSAVTDNVYLAEKHNSDEHFIGLGTDVENAGEWKFIATGDTLKNVNTLSYLKSNKYAEKSDTTKVLVYYIQNAENGEYLTYNATEGAACCGVTNAGSAAKFALKTMSDSTFNLVQVVTTYTLGENVKTTTSYGEKYYGAFSANKVAAGVNVYKETENDLFMIEKVAAPEYRELSMGDTVKIYKQGNEKIALYEQGAFLGMQHVADVDSMIAAMYVDTAYVRGGTNMPQYMLAKDVTRIVDNDNCNNANHAKHVTDTTYGRFLVNMADSAYAYGTEKHNNPYIWENTSSFKLAFVSGYHTKDTLFLTNAKGKVASKLAVGNNNNVGIAKYAFKYVDREEGSFIIETGTKTSKTAAVTKGYIKWLNGVPAVVADEDQAEVFNLKETSETPTANEEIAAAGVEVVAGEGFVTVRGAAGKKVVVANILGQTVASQTVASDEAQIAAPAGVVIVAVEGEAAVKAIVK